MRIDTHAVNIELTPALKRYAESKVWLAASRYASRVSWMGLWLVDYKHANGEPGMTCRIDAWLRSIGHVTVRHTENNIHVAVDIAAARLEQTIARTFRRAAQRRIAEARASDRTPCRWTQKNRSSTPRMAVVIERRAARQQLPLLPWLRIKYGIEQISRITVPEWIWESVADDSPMPEALENRIVLSQFGWPELMIVLGRSDATDPELAQEEQEQVRRIVRQIRAWKVPVEVRGIWIDEQWEPDCHVESRELDCSSTAKNGRQSPVDVLELHQTDDDPVEKIAVQQEVEVS